MNKTQRFREIAGKFSPYDDSLFDWYYETTTGDVIDIDGHKIKVVEHTNSGDVEKTYNNGEGDFIQWNIWVVVEFEGELYRAKGLDDSWDSPGLEDWERVEKRPVTTYEYVEVDNERD